MTKHSRRALGQGNAHYLECQRSLHWEEEEEELTDPGVCQEGSNDMQWILTCNDFLISSTEWCAKPFCSNSLAHVAAWARSGAMANNDTTDFISSSSFASRRTWARSCVVVFPSSATSYTHVRFLDWQVLHFGRTPSHYVLG